VKTFEILGSSGKSKILIGETLQRLVEYLPTGLNRTIVISDANVCEHYQNVFPTQEVIQIGTGEEIKNLATVQDVYERLLHFEADRSSFIVGIGGGIVCDIAGFVASTYMRGVRFGFVASTLLAQVDASVGGKNGVNFLGFKNIVGVFNQPEFVICDVSLLRTLPEKEILCGMAETVKHAAVERPDLFAFLEDRAQDALKLEPSVIEQIIFDSVQLKSAIVNRDEKEHGERRKLNFGHTFGHAIEKTVGLSHGEAISVGMVVASGLSVHRGLLAEDEATRIARLLRKLKLPTTIRGHPDRILDALRKDKKREGASVHVVLLAGIGRAVIEEIPLDELRTVIADLIHE
jgi:3-dehydroquinate synthase